MKTSVVLATWTIMAIKIGEQNSLDNFISLGHSEELENE